MRVRKKEERYKEIYMWKGMSRMRVCEGERSVLRVCLGGRCPCD
jgi:hypothetical protein